MPWRPVSLSKAISETTCCVEERTVPQFSQTDASEKGSSESTGRGASQHGAIAGWSIDVIFSHGLRALWEGSAVVLGTRPPCYDQFPIANHIVLDVSSVKRPALCALSAAGWQECVNRVELSTSLKEALVSKFGAAGVAGPPTAGNRVDPKTVQSLVPSVLARQEFANQKNFGIMRRFSGPTHRQLGWASPNNSPRPQLFCVRIGVSCELECEERRAASSGGLKRSASKSDVGQERKPVEGSESALRIPIIVSQAQPCLYCVAAAAAWPATPEPACLRRCFLAHSQSVIHLHPVRPTPKAKVLNPAPQRCPVYLIVVASPNPAPHSCDPTELLDGKAL
ncbi:hypothetical protein BDK51DRAFT_41881 [Blyttiomyces helicus]|uniref:Uncharacterized protein n=1 Tax=Blyttiomyces helicus TaxID=388810 RepID=A0A4P9WD02_9FUNG|nr:hypothetical protein BDK51DRAFT_41881 [Blyttiomyces helicus]|eukprot:RKO88246.1 hypothetical protein BDK51DRAFT_41881 [Blyttiomyces helicus]